MMVYVYVLHSRFDNGLYIGYSADLKKRLKQHEAGISFATSYRGPWTLIYYEAYPEEADALGRERYLKSGGGRRLPRMQLRHYFRNRPVRSKVRARASTA
jgi:putative endonuclease